MWRERKNRKGRAGKWEMREGGSRRKTVHHVIWRSRIWRSPSSEQLTAGLSLYFTLVLHCSASVCRSITAEACCRCENSVSLYTASLRSVGGLLLNAALRRHQVNHNQILIQIYLTILFIMCSHFGKLNHEKQGRLPVNAHKQTRTHKEEGEWVRDRDYCFIWFATVNESFVKMQM